MKVWQADYGSVHTVAVTATKNTKKISISLVAIVATVKYITPIALIPNFSIAFAVAKISALWHQKLWKFCRCRHSVKKCVICRTEQPWIQLLSFTGPNQGTHWVFFPFHVVCFCFLFMPYKSPFTLSDGNGKGNFVFFPSWMGWIISSGGVHIAVAMAKMLPWIGLMQTNGSVHMGTNTVTVAATQCEQGLSYVEIFTLVQDRGSNHEPLFPIA